MKRTTCEYMMWNGLPVIRKEIAESMITDYGLNQKETAEKLGITPAAVCQYLSKKRGRSDIADEIIRIEIKQSAKNIIKNGNGYIILETCRICKLIRKSTELELFCPGCDE
ncbi:MAG: transcriptional regulator [Candidatus Thermoplasmatota archaeon]|nr:transcriptional regulator [Candidatus Thermoplasmatota archaeon]